MKIKLFFFLISFNFLNCFDLNYEKLKYKLIISLNISTSSIILSETLNNITATFIGDFSVSGPHSLGSFKEPSITVNRIIKFDRIIGKLKQILLSNRGTDGWLMSDIRGTTEDYIYEFKWKRQWLDSIDPILLDTYGNGYEPFCQESLEQLPAKSTLLLDVINTIPVIDVSGMYRPDLASLET